MHGVTLVLGPAGFLGSNGEGPPKACWPWMTPPLPYRCRVHGGVQKKKMRGAGGGGSVCSWSSGGVGF